ncbi:hypothetical protein KDN32_05755 [Nocardioides sp. J2M5]|uniref:hypothetical protein n=1 Tax=Nocardioides palaemonis TaxID=2829810 RepID=UPI001BA6EB34|nr:hypothetical protein [Nocardioides palaemonis]MBS2937240.1 hypothetical protein [Nocardioides palaemonis]
MAPVSRRLARRIEHDFNPDVAETVTRVVVRASQSERVQAAIVLVADGDAREVARQAELARVDWRDVLVNAGLATENWKTALDQQLGR